MGPKKELKQPKSKAAKSGSVIGVVFSFIGHFCRIIDVCLHYLRVIYFILFYYILFYFILFYFILFYIILYYFILFYFIY